MELEPIILDSAHRHGVSDATMLHALRFPVRRFVQDDAMTMFIGPDETGTLVEVGVSRVKELAGFLLDQSWGWSGRRDRGVNRPGSRGGSDSPRG